MPSTKSDETAVQALLEVKEYLLDDAGVEISPGVRVTWWNENAVRVYQGRGFEITFTSFTEWKELATLWEAKRIPENKILVRRRLCMFSRDDEPLRDYVAKLQATLRETAEALQGVSAGRRTAQEAHCLAEAKSLLGGTAFELRRGGG